MSSDDQRLWDAASQKWGLDLRPKTYKLLRLLAGEVRRNPNELTELAKFFGPGLESSVDTFEKFLTNEVSQMLDDAAKCVQGGESEKVRRPQ